LKAYHDSAKDDEAFQQYLDEFVYGVNSHHEYLEAIGGAARLEELRADRTYGYSPTLIRRRLE